MNARTKGTAPSTLRFRDETQQQWAAQFAYAIWLAVPAVALRTEGDERPVQPWDLIPCSPATISPRDVAGFLSAHEMYGMTAERSDLKMPVHPIKWPA